jgi:gamma-glutamyltranspeptidase/glutathione hydrolase
VVPGAGFALNNFLYWADLDPASPAAIVGGRPASETDISCMSPVMVWGEGGDLEYALGAPSGPLLSTMVYVPRIRMVVWCP